MSESKNELNGCFKIGCAIWVLFCGIVFTLLISRSCSSSPKTEYEIRREMDDRLKTLSSKSERTEKEWEELNEILKSKYIGSDDECVRNAIANKDWRMLELLKKNHVSFKRDSLISCMNKKSLYSAEDVARLFAIAGLSINIDDVIEAQKNREYSLAMALMQHVHGYRQTQINEFTDNFIESIDVEKLRSTLQKGSIERDNALMLLGKKIFLRGGCSDEDWQLFNELLRWKKENSKVWTLY